MPRLRAVVAGTLASTVVLTSACSTWSRKEQGAAIGAGAGAVVGGVVGKQVGNTARGAIVGAVLGGAAGAIIGHQMDQQARELMAAIPGARVERVGEGIAVTFDSGLLFAFDSDVVQGAARSNLQNLAKSLEKHNGSQVLIVGHTDDVGSDSYNQSLSARRADAARATLVSDGVDRSRIETSGRGETEPIAANGSDSGRSQNRRVEVAIYAGPEQRAAAQRSARSGFQIQ